MGCLGTPEHYEAWIVDGVASLSEADVTPVNVLVALDWATINWERVENEISTASVVVPTALASKAAVRSTRWGYGGRPLQPMPLRAYIHWLYVLRDGVIVWRGPIISWSGPVLGGTMEITAWDALAYAKRRMVVDQSVTDGDLWDAVHTMVVGIGSSSPPWPLLDPATLNPGGTSGITYSREYLLSERLYLFDALLDLTKLGLWFSCGPTAVSYDSHEFLLNYFNLVTTVSKLTKPAPTLNEHTVLNNPQVGFDGRGLVGQVYADSVDADGNRTSTTVPLDPAMDQTYASVDGAQFESVVRGEVGFDALGEAQRILTIDSMPSLSTEPMILGPRFGSTTGWGTSGTPPSVSDVSGVAGFAGINDLRPGLVARWGFDTPQITYDQPIGAYRPGLDTYWGGAGEIEYAWLSRVEVQVTKREGDIQERILGSFRPAVV